MLRSYRAKLQAAFLALGFGAIGLTGWEASAGATAALRQATHDRLTAIRQAHVRQIESYFADLGNHVLALSNDDSTLRAIQEFKAAWPTLDPLEVTSVELLRTYYDQTFAPTVARDPAGPEQAAAWFPADPRTRRLQHLFLAANPHPVGAKDRMLEAPGRYGAVHTRYHPTLHRYQTAFGFYDLFLIGADPRRVLYTVFKEIDLGVPLDEAPYRDSPLAAVTRDAMALTEPEQFVLRDYQPYLPSHLTPAAFVAAPIWRAGSKVGVLAIQVSVDEINRVMTANGEWREEGLGETGQSYIVGPDGALRSDMRRRIEAPERYFAELKQAGVKENEIDEVRRHNTAVLHPVTAREGMLRSHARLNVPGLDWTLVVEIDEQEAFAPVSALRKRTLGIGALIAAAFLLAAAVLARSVTRPVRALADGARRLGAGDFSTRLAVESSDEVGQLAAAFNRMAGDLERTTVSKTELEKLAGRLITAQEEERRRVARELHDDVSQRMAAAAIEAGMLDRIPEHDEARRRDAVARIRANLAGLSDEIHALSRRLHPAMLDELGLQAAVEAECRGWFDRGGAPVDTGFDGDVESLPAPVRLTFYRVVQEALRNIQKYASAESVRVRIGATETQAALTVEDDGVGFDIADPDWRRGLGLASMEERARLIGGSFGLHTAPGKGTKIEIRVPLEPT